MDKSPGDGGPGPAQLFEVAGEALDVRAVGVEQPQVVALAPGDVLAQVEGVGVAGLAAVAGEEPGEGEALGFAEHVVGNCDVGCWDGGYVVPPGRAETGGRARRPQM